MEATSAIEHIYDHYIRFGEWPDQDTLEAICRETLPSDWSCEARESQPVLSVRGAYHLSLYYHFEPPSKGAPTREWSFNIEGSNRYFQADDEYSVEQGQ